jgi:type IV pilus modification protein PilV
MRINSQHGFALLEALIAMFITAGVLLGLGVLHLKSVQQSALTTQRTIATMQANDLIDRMWASVCSLDDTSGQLNEATTGTMRAIETQWKNRWKITGSSFTPSSAQKALHNRMTEWSGSLQPIRETDGTFKRRYKIKIEWENKKAKWYASDPAQKESFIYYFSVPKCDI